MKTASGAALQASPFAADTSGFSGKQKAEKGSSTQGLPFYFDLPNPQPAA
jgi:hypothetical protein